MTAASIERLDPRRARDVDSVGRLHETLLADSPVIRMGPRFVRDIYYGRLVADGLIDCLLCRIQDRTVAFLAYTDRPSDFMAEGFRRHWGAIAWSVSTSVMVRPQRMGGLLHVVRLMRSRRERSSASVAQATAEALSFGVLPEFESIVPDGATCRVALRLFRDMANDLRARRVERLRVHVQPRNQAANLFYSALDCRFEQLMTPDGAVHRYTCDIRRLCLDSR